MTYRARIRRLLEQLKSEEEGKATFYAGMLLKDLTNKQEEKYHDRMLKAESNIKELEILLSEFLIEGDTVTFKTGSQPHKIQHVRESIILESMPHTFQAEHLQRHD